MKRSITSAFFILVWMGCHLFAQGQSIVIKPRPTKETILALPDFQVKDGGQGPGLQEYTREMNETIWNDLEYSSFFRLLGKSLYPSHRVSGTEDLVFKDWQNLNMGIDFIVTGNMRISDGWLEVQCRMFDMKTQEQVMGKLFRARERDNRGMAHRISDKIIQLLTANASRGVSSTQIAFERKTTTGKEIFIMDYDGAGLRPLTSNRSINLTPTWSPSAKQVCFTSYQFGTPALCFMNTGSGVVQPFNVKGGLLTTPAYSPNGKEIAFAGRLNDSSDTDIYVATLDGKQVRNVTQHPGIDICPAWSPTGRQLAFVSSRSGVPQIFLCDSYGAGVDRLTQEGGYASSPAWSPDGRYIAFSWKPSRMAYFDIFIVEVATKKIIQLTQGVGNNENPSWSPDGFHICLQSDRSGSNEIYTMNADGTNPRQITNLKGCSNPDWSAYGSNE